MTLSASAQDVVDRLPEGWVDCDPILPSIVAAFAQALDTLDAVAADGDDGSPGWLKLVDPDAADTVGQVAWAGQLVGATVPPGASLVEARAAVTDSPGWQRGTPDAIRAAARPFLQPGSGDVMLTERAGGDAWALSIVARDDQIGGNRYYKVKATYATYAALASGVASYGALVANQAAAQAAALAAVPAGIIATFTVVPAWTYADAASEWASYGALAAAVADYQALLFYST